MTHRRLSQWAGEFVREVIASPFARNVALLVSGTAIGYGLTALASPVLSRLFSPADFGVLAVFASIVSILGEAGTGRYELAIVLPKADHDAANLLALTCGIVLAASAVVLLAVAVAGRAFADLLGSSDLAPFLWWVPLALLIIGLDAALSHWLTRLRAFRQLSVMQICRSTGTAITQVAAGFARTAAAGLIGGRVAGEVCGLAGLALQVPREDRRRIRSAVRLSEIRRVARAYADFPKFSMPQGLINAISQSVPAFMLTALYNSQVVGLYAMGHRLLYLPSRFLGQSVRQVYLQKASEAHAHGGDLHRLFARTTLGLVALGTPLALAVILFGPPLFRIALGPAWGESGVYAQWMVLWLFFGFINPPAAVLLQVLRLQHWLLLFDVALLAARCGALLIGGRSYSPLTTIALFSIVGAVFNAALPIALWFYTRRHRPSPSLDSA